MPTNQTTKPKISLSALAESIQTTALRETQVEVGDLFGSEQPSDVVFTYREADLPRLYQLYEDARAIRKRNPDFSEGLCADLATLATFHVAPIAPGDAPATFYIQIARQNAALFGAILERFRAAFPTADAELDAAKNG